MQTNRVQGCLKRLRLSPTAGQSEASQRRPHKHRAKCIGALLIAAFALPALAQHHADSGHGGGNHFGAAPRMNWREPQRHSPWHPSPPRDERLPQWFHQHEKMNFAEQRRALSREPGFHRLSPEQQTRILNQLHRLDSLPPAQRRRILARNEAFERLSPERKQEVRAAVQAFHQMPPQQRQQLRAAFQQLRQMPPKERKKILKSSQMKALYDGRERHILGNLLSIEPYEPPSAASQ